MSLLIDRNAAKASHEYVVGSRVHCALYGGHDGIVYRIQGKQSPQSCRSLGGGVSVGGNANFHIVFDDHISVVPEVIVRGVQWRLLDGVAGQSEIDAALAHVAVVKAAAEVKAKADAEQFRKDRAALEAEHPYLLQGDKRDPAKNVRLILKRNFPGVKFSVRKDNNSLRVVWIDGPTAKRVEAFVDRFVSGHFDGMTDCYTYSESPWNAAFGGVRYVFTERNVSEALVQKAIDLLCNEYGGTYPKPSAARYQEGREYNISPIGNFDGSHHWSWQGIIGRKLVELE